MTNEDFSAIAFSGRYDEALAACRAAVPDVWADHAASFISGYCLFHTDRPQDAGRYFIRALELAPGDIFAMSYAVRALHAAGSVDEALARAADYVRDWHGSCASDTFDALIEAAVCSLPQSGAPELRSRFLAALLLRRMEVSGKVAALLTTATLWARGLDATHQLAPIMSIPAAVAAGLGRFLWQGQPDTICFAAIEGAPRANTTGVRATVSGYPAYVAALAEASVSGQSSAVFGAGGEILSDTYADARYGDAVDLRADTVIRLRHGNAALLDLAKPTRRIEQAINLAGLTSNHFGHWFSEFLPRLRHIVQLPELASTPILVNADMPESHFELLERLCDNSVLRVSRDEVIKVGTLIVAPTIGFFPFSLKPGHSVPIEHQAAWSAPAMRFIRDKVLATVDSPTPTTRDAIYLSRENSSWGRPLNEDALLARCSALELRTVHLESMDFAEQVATIRCATTIVAPTGSALNMLMFARPETRLIILAQRHPHNWGGWVGPLRQIGVDPCMIMSAKGDPVSKHAGFEIDIDGLTILLKSDTA